MERGVKRPPIARQIVSGCLLGRVRYLSRRLSSIYDEELRPFGMQASQLNSLALIAANGPMRRTELGRWLHLDSSTLTRNLRIMLSNGWIEEVPDGKDGRGRPLSVTEAGTELLRQLSPAWRMAQSRARELLGSEGTTALTRLFDMLHEAEGA